MKNNRVLALSAMGAAALCATTGCAEAESAQKKMPNVIFVLADDLGYGDLGCYGQTKFATPNIDMMAQQGIQFTQNYAGCTVSAPSRCALVTGKHTGNTYVRGNKGDKCVDGRTYDTSIPDEEFTLGELFKSKGYATACVGKWGMGGPESVGHPNNQGFDYFYGYLGQGHAHHYYPKFLHENSTEITLDGKTQYSHDLIEGKAFDFIRENKDNPFFLYLTFTLPHAELVLPEQYMEPYMGKYPENKPFVNNGGSYGSQPNTHAAFASMVTRLDQSVGSLYALLEELGIDDNTLVVFASDNGAHQEGGADPKFFKSTGIYRGVKRALHEGGIRVPMLATYPGYITPGTKSDEMIAFWDVMPTFAELIGADAPKGIDGLSFLSVLRGQPMEKKHDYLYWEFHEQGGRQAVRQGDWKLIKQQASNPKKTYYQLYNLVQDPSENDNVVEQYPEVVEHLQTIMAGARTQNPIWNY